MRVDVVDPSAFTPPYDHALCAALARAGASVQLITSRFAYGAVPEPDGYVVREWFYRRARGGAGSPVRRATKLVEHVPDMLRYRRHAGDVVHFQWLDVPWLDASLLPSRPVVITAHDLLPREPRPGQARAQRRLYDRVDAVVVHSEYGRRQLVEGLALDPAKVHVIHHGAFEHLTHVAERRLPAELAAPPLGPVAPPRSPVAPPPNPVAPPPNAVALFFGLLRPYKGIETLLEAWRGIDSAELWIVGRPMLDLAPLREAAPPGVRFVPRFVDDAEVAALFERADVVVLPYSRTERFDQSGVLATALAFGKPAIISDVGGFGEVAATGAAGLVPPDDPAALHAALAELLGDGAARDRFAAAARAAAAGPYSWDEAARRTLALYRDVIASRS
jgi:glycosyltransferase involved in cell wall biosynthesis